MPSAPMRRKPLTLRLRLAGLVAPWLAVLALSAPEAATAQVQVYYDALQHPRLLVNPAAVARARAFASQPGTMNYTILQRVRSYVDGRLAEPKPVGTGYRVPKYLDDLAALYLLTGDPAYGDAAVEIAMYALAHGQEIDGPGSGPGEFSTLALAYDWCHDRFDPAEREVIAAALAQSASTHRSVRSQLYWLHTWDWYWSLSIVEDAPSYGGISNEQVRVFLEEYLNDYASAYFVCLDGVSPGGYVEYYPGRRHQRLMMLQASVTGICDWDPASSSYIHSLPRVWTSRYRPDGEWTRTLSKYNYTSASPYFFFSFFGSRSEDELAQSLIDAIDDDYGTCGSDACSQAYLYLLFHDPTKPSRSLASYSSLELDYRDAGSGVYMGRSGLSLGPGSRDVMAAFFCGPFTFPYRAHDDKALGHFVLSRGDDCLLIDSGYYTNDVDGHYGPYYTSTTAHNTVVIIHPGQQWENWNDCHEHPNDLPRPNDGGQDPVDRDEGARRWPMCVFGTGSTASPGYNGEITVYEADDRRVLIEADMSHAYRSRASRVLRRWVYLRPDWFLVQDRVDLLPGCEEDTVRSLFHCVDRPACDGLFAPLRGAWNRGGVFASTTTGHARIELEDSAAHLYFLGMYPRAGSATVRMVGGVNGGSSANAGWQQDHDPLSEEPEPSTYYDTYTPGDISYEFYSGGRNYTPLDTNCRIKDGNYQVRNDRSSGGKANPAGDWRLEYQAALGHPSVTLNVLIHVTDAGAPMADVASRWSATGDTLIVRFVGSAGDSVRLDLSRPGERWSEAEF